MGLEERILKLLGQRRYTPLDVKGIGRHLGLKTPERLSQLQKQLDQLEQQGRVARVRHNRYALPRDADLVAGRLFIKRSGEGILQPDAPQQPPVFIPEESTGTALLHDRVLVRLEARHPAAPEEVKAPRYGKVIRILHRVRTQLVGVLQRTSQFFYVVPDDPRIPHDIYVPEPRKLKRRPRIGDKVVVELVEWPSRHNSPEGRIVTVLGRPDQPGVDIESIIKQYNLPKSFPKEVRQEAEALPAQVPARDLKGREDCRGQTVVTIDPEDAQDFDDGFYLERRQDRWKLWIHVADVSHYVKPGSALDREAAARATSTYLVDRVVPMLPEKLSNNLCSLKPQVDRLSKCVEVTLSKAGKVLESRLYPAVIQSKRRFTYTEVMEILERKPNGPLERMVTEASRLAQKLRKDRLKNGALDLDFPDYRIRLDDQGRVREVEKSHNDLSHQLIEEFMLLANEMTARRLKKLNRLSVFRIHEKPEPERLEEFRQEVLRQGIQCGNLTKGSELQKLLAKLKTHKAGPALTIALLRSMKRARYSVDPLGHYGLAKENYTHFTSPIRRYADLIVHRSLFEKIDASREQLAEQAEHISFMERNAGDAEQDSKTVKLQNFLSRQLESQKPTTYDAIVTEIRNFGFFVEVEALGVSGCIRLSTMEDDFYIYDPKRGRLRGRRRQRTIELGDRVRVRVASVDPIKKHIDFHFVGDEKKKESKRPRKRDQDRPRRKRAAKSR